MQVHFVEYWNIATPPRALSVGTRVCLVMASTEDLRAAVASLEASTSAIQKEAETLEKNRVYLESLRTKNSQIDDSERHRARRLENQNLSLIVGKFHSVSAFISPTGNRLKKAVQL